MRPIRIAALAVTAVSLGAAASAQSLSELLPRLLSESVTMPSTAGNVAGNPHEAHFLPAAAQLKAPYALNSALVTQLSTFPLGSSSGGFTYTTDEKTGIPQRSSTNFGPAFAERALTNGKGRFTAGFNLQHVEFDQFEGQGLDGGVRFYLQHNDCCPLPEPRRHPQSRTGAFGPSADKNPCFEGDLVRTDLTLKAQTDTAVFFANYGITNRLDLGVAVPIVKVDLDAPASTPRSSAWPPRANPAIHSFGGASPDQRSARSRPAPAAWATWSSGQVQLPLRPGRRPRRGSRPAPAHRRREGAAGHGRHPDAGLALYYSARLRKALAPRQRGLHVLQRVHRLDASRAYALGDEVPPPPPRRSEAYDTVFRGPGPRTARSPPPICEVPDEINYTVGLRPGPSPQVHAERRLHRPHAAGREPVRGDPPVVQLPDPTAAGDRPRTRCSRRTFTDGLDIIGRGNLNLFLGVVGVKINVTKTLLLNANVLFPLSNDGLRPKVTPVIGLDYAF